MFHFCIPDADTKSTKCRSLLRLLFELCRASTQLLSATIFRVLRGAKKFSCTYFTALQLVAVANFA